ncbi:MAG: 3-mercaptopyruvate sulfurtransferase [Bauldia sp.]|nr:3-mercaptopyruvate sulfurtransferase [Bauldia sp.]
MIDRSRWLVSTDWLSDHLDDPDVVIVDGSWHLPGSGRDGRREYEAAHIPGAVFFDIDAVADTSNPLPHMLPTPEAFADAVGTLGIDETLTIVVYDSLGLFSAPRVWWTFRVMGAWNVVILDGGLPKWRAEGRPVDDRPVSRSPRRFRTTFDGDAVRDMAEVRDGIAAGTLQLVDARPRARFLGEAPEPRSWVKSGRIPGSLNLPSSEVVADGRMKEPAELKAAFAAAGVDPAKPIVTSCGSGVNAAILTLALEMIGVERSGLYDGSWTEWGGRNDTPVAVGPEWQ